MAKMLWRKLQAAPSKQGSGSPVRAGGVGAAMPRGYVPMRLVGDGGEDDKHDETVLVPVALLKQPRMVELLEMAERQYGYGQPGVLRIPCDARRFEQLMGLACMAR
ncbi:auxin-responsive protein SAUR40-like [Miscanthus floridulus]|uniref:auxin-responsive protein SAUR40-like n=1 Tax=Miscanthus floridulus TaxID=154761 RepID=UPI00345A792B